MPALTTRRTIRLLAVSLALAGCCVGVHAQASTDMELEALLAAQKPEDVAALRKDLPGKLSAKATMLLARSNAAGARRSALIETIGPAYPEVTLLVDRGTETWVYDWLALPSPCDRRGEGRVSVREIPLAEFEEDWAVLQGRKQSPPSRDREQGGEQEIRGYDGFVQMRTDSQPSQYLLSPDDFETLRRSSAFEDLIFGHTFLGLGEYHPGVRRTPAWFSQLQDRLGYGPGTPRNRQHWALEDSVEHQRWDEASAFVKAGADPDFPNWNGSTLLSQAVAAGNCDAVARLLALGADPAKPDFLGNVPAELDRRRNPNGSATACLKPPPAR